MEAHLRAVERAGRGEREGHIQAMRGAVLHHRWNSAPAEKVADNHARSSYRPGIHRTVG
jgi:hypothetical protein